MLPDRNSIQTLKYPQFVYIQGCIHLSHPMKTFENIQLSLELCHIAVLMGVDEKSLQTHSSSSSSPSFIHSHRNPIQTVKRSQRSGLSHINSTFSQHSHFLHSRSSNIYNFSATFTFLYWCVLPGVLTARVEEPTDRMKRSLKQYVQMQQTT